MPKQNEVSEQGIKNIQNDERWGTMYREAKAFVAYPNTKIEIKDLRTAELVAEFALNILDLKQASVDKQATALNQDSARVQALELAVNQIVEQHAKLGCSASPCSWCKEVAQALAADKGGA